MIVKKLLSGVLTTCRNLLFIVVAIYLSSLNPYSTTDKKKLDTTEISTNGFYYIRDGDTGYLFAVIDENGRHKRDRNHRKIQSRYR
jgi:hypothetical protein